MDATTLATLLDRHGAALQLYARQWTAAPEDVVQEAFIKLAQADVAPDLIAPWLFRVVRNAALTALRAEQRRKRHETRAGGLRQNWFVASDDAPLDAEELVAALGQLEPAQREAITLHFWGGLSFSEIADVMECSASSAHRWYQAGIETLRGKMSCPTTIRPK